MYIKESALFLLLFAILMDGITKYAKEGLIKEILDEDDLVLTSRSQ